MLDMRVPVSIRYQLEGDRLELLLVYDRIERLRKLGETLCAGGQGVSSNLDDALCSSIRLVNGAQLEKVASLLPPTHSPFLSPPSSLPPPLLHLSTPHPSPLPPISFSPSPCLLSSLPLLRSPASPHMCAP